MIIIYNDPNNSVNRFLQREEYTPRDLFNEVGPDLNLTGGISSVDDTVLDKPYAHHMPFVGHFRSGKHHRVVRGINVVTLYYCDIEGRHRPVNWRMVDKTEGKTKNGYFHEMLTEVLEWGLEPADVTGDSWYSGTKNLKEVKNHNPGLMFATERVDRPKSLSKVTIAVISPDSVIV